MIFSYVGDFFSINVVVIDWFQFIDAAHQIYTQNNQSDELSCIDHWLEHKSYLLSKLHVSE